ncbi:MAG: glycosyltransferase [Promethearchaeota archaeon]
MKNAANKPWRLKIDQGYKPKVSILVPTYNEASIIGFKLENLSRLEYPKEMTQIILVDSNSDDQTLLIANNFVKQRPKMKVQVLTESERRGKSAALNCALKHCEGDVIIVSDADCFWPSDALEKALPFLADPNVGAISGPKILLNPEQSWITRTEDAYLNSANLLKLGESKIGSTLLFEGGFSAYKKDVIEAFDPYGTGSDDSGTVIKVVESSSRAILVPEARFFSAFPTTWKGKMGIKTRRANQLVRVFSRYAALLLRKRVKNSKRVISQNLLVYLVSPTLFILLLVTAIPVLMAFPYIGALLAIFLVPRVRTYLFETVQSYLVLFLSILSVALGKKIIAWDKPEDRGLFIEDMLRQRMLI